VIESLKAEGVAIIYITHFLDEIFTVCERISIMRKWRDRLVFAMSEVDASAVVHLMLAFQKPRAGSRAGLRWRRRADLSPGSAARAPCMM